MKKKITFRDLVKMHPCYHPNDIGIKNGYSATIPDFIKEYRDKVKNKEDLMWVLCRDDYMTDRDMRLFAVWCAREALKLVDTPDERSINACNVAEKYANGEATDMELAAAWAAAGAAAWAAARAAAGDAAGAAAGAAAWDAARDAAGAAARDAARAAAWDAAWAAAWAAAGAAAWDAARAAAGDAQIDKLLTYF